MMAAISLGRVLCIEMRHTLSVSVVPVTVKKFRFGQLLRWWSYCS